MRAAAAPLLVFNRPRGADKESWGPAFLISVAAHGVLLSLFLSSSPKKETAPTTILTAVNFIEKPAEEAPPASGPAPAGSPLEASAQAPQTAPVVSFGAPSAGPVKAEAVAAPIIPSAPIAPGGQLGVIGVKRGALAPLPAHADTTAARKGPVPMPMAGTPRGTGQPIALNTQGVGDIRNRSGGPVLPMLTQAAGGGGGGPVGRPLGPADSGLAAPRKAPIETLKAGAVDKDAWGKKSSPFSLEGPLKYRKIKAMQMPPYPRWAEEKGVEAAVSYRLWVDPKGKVIEAKIYLEKTSAYAELDALAKEALLKFVFVPIPDGQPAEEEWGVATFRFELKK